MKLTVMANSARSRGFLLPLILMLLQACQGGVPDPASSAGVRQPNFVIILADDLGYGDISPFAGRIATPTLERMAAEGLRVTDFHTSGTVCSPTRAGLMTGRYQQRAGIPGVVLADPNGATHHHGLQDHEVTIAELLRDNGYATAIFGKWHLGYDPKYNPLENGFDTFSGFVAGNVDYFSHVDQAGAEDWWLQDRKHREEGYATRLITDHAVSFIRANKNKPFFLFVSHAAPHYPYQGPADKAEREAGSEFDDVFSADGDVDATYREMVEELDQGVGHILDELANAGIDERTLVLFLSDNGADQRGSNAPFRGSKGSEWEGGHRVPFIARWPESIQAGITSAEFATSLDIMPTLVELAGIEQAPSPRMDGISLVHFLLDAQPLGQREFHWNGKAVRVGNWKLVNTESGPQLFDLEVDPGENNNLAVTNADRLNKMLGLIENWEIDVSRSATIQPHVD